MTLSARVLSDGAQQHVAMRFAGEMLDLEGFMLGTPLILTSADTPSVVVMLSRMAIADLMSKVPELSRHIRREMAVNTCIAHERMVSLGRRSALCRVAHLLCEMHTRLEDLGLKRDGAVDFPLTQNDLADLLGLSVVHLNRKLQDLRRDGLVELTRKRLRLLDKDRLVEICGFDAAYLKPAASL